MKETKEKNLSLLGVTDHEFVAVENEKSCRRTKNSMELTIRDWDVTNINANYYH